MSDFRFEDLEIWKLGIEISDKLFDIVDSADEKRLFKFAEQLRAAGMSITNNIAEGSGSFSNKEFSQFLNISRRSIFECANILIIFERRRIISYETSKDIYGSLLKLSKMTTSFRKSLNSHFYFLPYALCSVSHASSN